MTNISINTRVRPKLDFLSEGIVIGYYDATNGKRVYFVKLDEKAPFSYAYDTDEVMLTAEELEAIE